MEFRDKPMQNLVRIPEKDICKNAQKLLPVCFADEHEAKFGFIGQDDLFAVANAISRRIL